MGRLTKYLHQVALYWGPLGNDRFAQAKFADPIEVICRWEDVRQEFIAKTGGTEVSRSRVVVEVDLTTEGYLWLSQRTKRDSPGSALNDIEGVENSTDPVAFEGAYAIRAFNKIPDRRAKEFFREALL